MKGLKAGAFGEYCSINIGDPPAAVCHELKRPGE